MKRVSLLLTVVLVGIWLVVSFTNVFAQNMDTLVVAQAATLETLDPHASNTDTTIGPLMNIFEGLTQRDPNGKILPALATGWKRIDAVAWEFTLRKGVKFQNGDPFTAKDVKFSLERIRDLKTSRWMTTGKMIKSVNIIGKYIVEVRTVEPFPILVENLHQIAILDSKYVEAHPDKVATNPVGTGPYKFVEWVPGDHLTLIRNEDYWGEKPPIKKVILRPIIEESTRLAALESGEVDLITDVPVEAASRVASDPHLDLVVRPGRRVIFFGMNQRPGSPMSDLRVRQALYMAINEQEIIDKVMGGYAAPASQLVDPACTGYNSDIKRLPYDPKKARQLLEEAGYPKGFNLTIDVPFDRYVMDEQIGVAVAVYLSKVGINVDLRTHPKSVHFSNILKGKTNFYMLGWSEGTFDSYRALTMLARTPNPQKGYGAWNAGAYSNPKLDQLLDKSAQTVDVAERTKILKEANAVAMATVAAIPLHYQVDLYGVSKHIDFKPRIDKWILFKDVSFKE